MTRSWTYPPGDRGEFARWIIRVRAWQPGLYISTPWFHVDLLCRCVGRGRRRYGWFGIDAQPPLTFWQSLRETFRAG
jgi:hypothetical protein